MHDIIYASENADQVNKSNNQILNKTLQKSCVLRLRMKLN